MLVENMRKHLNVIIENSAPTQQSQVPAVDPQTIAYGTQALKQLLSQADMAAAKLTTSSSTSQNTTNNSIDEGVGTALKGAVGAMIAALSIGAAAQSSNSNANPVVAQNLAVCAAHYNAASKALAGTPLAVTMAQLAQVSYNLGMQNKNRSYFEGVYSNHLERLANRERNAPNSFVKYLGQKVDYCNGFLENLMSNAK